MMTWHDITTPPTPYKTVFVAVKVPYLGGRVAIGSYHGRFWESTIEGMLMKWGNIPAVGEPCWSDTTQSTPEPCQRVALIVSHPNGVRYAIGGVDMYKAYFNHIDDSLTALYWMPLPLSPV